MYIIMSHDAKVLLDPDEQAVKTTNRKREKS